MRLLTLANDTVSTAPTPRPAHIDTFADGKYRKKEFAAFFSDLTRLCRLPRRPDGSHR